LPCTGKTPSKLTAVVGAVDAGSRGVSSGISDGADMELAVEEPRVAAAESSVP